MEFAQSDERGLETPQKVLGTGDITIHLTKATCFYLVPEPILPWPKLKQLLSVCKSGKHSYLFSSQAEIYCQHGDGLFLEEIEAVIGIGIISRKEKGTDLFCCHLFAFNASLVYLVPYY